MAASKIIGKKWVDILRKLQKIDNHCVKLIDYEVDQRQRRITTTK